MFIRDILYYTNRVNKLSNNEKENGNIVKKLKRKIRNLEKSNG